MRTTTFLLFTLLATVGFFTLPAAATVTWAPKSAFARFMPSTTSQFFNKFVYDVLAPTGNTTFSAGQEIRVRIRTQLLNTEVSSNITVFLRRNVHNNRLLRNSNFSFFPAMNITGPSTLRLRMIPAYGSRTSYSGTEVRCRVHTEVWHERRGFAGRTFAWGKTLAFSAFATFVVPPFPWKLCLQDNTVYNVSQQTPSRPWSEFVNYGVPSRVTEPQYLYQTANSMVTGDFASLKIIVHGRPNGLRFNGKNNFDPAKRYMSGTNLLRGDSVKLVPAGFPCTYEKASSTADLVQNVNPVLALTTNQYCGSNYIKAVSGNWVNLGCIYEGSVADGVAMTGSNRKNPWATLPSATITPLEPIPTGVSLLAYLRLPAAGSYDVCYSPRSYRTALLNITLSASSKVLFNAAPVWFKVFKTDGLTCPTSDTQGRVSTCFARTTSFSILPATPANIGLMYVPSAAIQGSWGTIAITGTNLSSAPASTWEYSNPREYWSTVGGDQFRLVPDTNFVASPVTVYGDLYVNSNGDRLKVSSPSSLAGLNRADAPWSTVDGPLTTSGQATYTQYTFGKPHQGTPLTAAGCWTTADNFGGNWALTNGNPGSQCCTASATGTCTSSACSMSDTDTLGVTSSGDLGNNPRSPYNPWAQDTEGTPNVWAYVRFLGGNYRVCYRRRGTENWRQVVDSNGTYTLRVLGRHNYTYSINDTRAETLGVFTVQSTVADLTTQTLNIYDTTVTNANVVGSALKIVSSTQDCLRTDPGARQFSTSAGLAECTMAACGMSSTCSGCLGPADDSTTKRRSIVFQLQLPTALLTQSSYYRICFRNGLGNWLQLPNPTYTKNLWSASSTKFNPVVRHAVYYTLPDRRAGTLGRFIFQRSTYGTPKLRSIPGPIGDVVRLVPNATSRGIQTTCGMPWGATSTATPALVAQNFNPLYALNNLGIYCTSGSSASGCATALVAPTDGSGIVGTYPYTSYNSLDDSATIADTDGTVAFITLPPRALYTSSPSGYRVCYKQGGNNWIEAMPLSSSQPRYLLVSPNPGYSMYLGSNIMYGGMYTYIGVQASSFAPVYIGYDILKLVPLGQTCDRPASGSLAYNNMYHSMARSGPVRGGAVVVDGTSDTTAFSGTQPTTTTNARFYMSLPTVNTTTFTTSAYSVCYMTRSSSTDVNPNWQNLGTITVTSIGVAFDVISQPIQGGVTQVRVLSTSVPLNTTAGGDQMKVVTDNSPCVDGNVPSGISSLSVAQEHGTLSTTGQTAGFTDLGPSNAAQTFLATINITMPLTGTAFKVCYKPIGRPWMQVEQVFPQQQTYPLGTTSGLPSVSSGITSFTLSTAAQAVPPSSTWTNYAGSIAWTSTVVAGFSLYNGSFTHLTVASTNVQSLSSYDKIKFVLVAAELSVAGTYDTYDGINCGSNGIISNATASTLLASYSTAMLPTTPGRYLFCYQVAGTVTWIQLSNTNTNLGNPFYVIASNLWFTVDAVNRRVLAQDLFSSIATGTSYGGLVAQDSVYIAPSNATCGVSADARGTAVSGATLLLSNNLVNGSSFSASRYSVTASWISTSYFVSNTGPFVICVQRTNAYSTTTSGIGPYLPYGWYAAINSDTNTGLGTGFYAPAAPVALKLDSCPPYNLTNKIRTGSVFSSTVRIVDGAGNQISATVGTWAYLVTATGAFNMINTLGQCRQDQAALYGWDSFNLRQYATAGVASFSIAPTSVCPSGGCSLTFASTGLTATTPCSFDVQPTIAATLAANASVTTCAIGTTCTFVVTAFHTDRDVAHTATDSISVAATLPGISATVSRTGTTSTSAFANSGSATVGSLINGFISIDITFAISDASQFVTDTVVVLIFKASSTSATTSYQITVPRPTVVGVHIVDLYASTSSEAPMPSTAFIDPRFVPTWEPNTSYVGGAFTQVTGQSTLAAAKSYHLVAQQFYTVTLRLVVNNGAGLISYLSDLSLLNTASRQLTVTLPDLAVRSGNAVLAYTSDCATNDGCATPFTAVTLSGGQTKVVFRLKNSIGCTLAGGGCTISFLFGGVAIGSPTTIVTPVRSMATTLTYNCWVAPTYISGGNNTIDRTTLGSASSSGCPSSTVGRGWVLDVYAVDDFGNIDEYFSGSVIGYLAVPYQSKVLLTTVRILYNGTAVSTPISATASSGVATFDRLTLSQQCTSGCTLSLYSTWGTGLTTVGSMIATSPTVRLGCSLATQLVACRSVSDGCANITSNFTYSTTQPNANNFAAIYPDTTLCFNVFSADANGQPTLSETEWVHYSVRTWSGANVDPVDSTGSLSPGRRYAPLSAGRATFCFAPSSSGYSNFSVTFYTQQFGLANHWTSGSTGQCQMGWFSVFPQKAIGGLVVTSMVATGVTQIATLPTASAEIMYGIQAGTQKSFVVGLSATDYYGNPITKSQVLPADSNVGVVIESCRYDNVATTCIQGTVGASSGSPNVVTSTDPAIVGAITVGVPSLPTYLVSTGAVSYSLYISKFCVGCIIAFSIQRQDNAVLNSTIYSVYNGSTSVPANFRATIKVHALVNSDTTGTRYVGMKPATSPYRGHWTSYSATGDLNTIRTSNVALYNASCLNIGSNCLPPETSFMESVCGTASTYATMNTNPAGDPLQFYVAVGESGYSPNSYLELGCTLNTCTVSSLVKVQADIGSTYTVAVTIGLQLLTCLNGACTDDSTIAPKRTITSYGTTMAAALSAFIASGYTLKTANFTLAGLQSTGYYPKINSTFNGTSLPKGGSLTVTATSTTTGIFVTPLVDRTWLLLWRGGRVGQTLKFLSTSINDDCPQVTTLKCLSGSSGICPYTGYETPLTLTQIAVNYTAGAFVGIPVPITVQVTAADGAAVFDAAGTVTVSLYSWEGCNNGGTVTMVNSGALTNGRMTSFVTFSAPCQQCTLRAVVTPTSPGAEYGNMPNSPASLIAYSSPITVVAATPLPSRVMIMTSPSTLPYTLTIASTISIDLKTVANLGNLQVDSAGLANVAVYNTPMPPSTSSGMQQYWYGNGGYLRSSTSAPYYTRHGASVSFTGTGTVTFAFTRTCQFGCQVLLYYEIPSSGSSGTVIVRNSHPQYRFFVFTALSTTAVVGAKPRAVSINNYFAVAVWHLGSELATTSSNPIAIAGVANGSYTSPLIPSFQIVDSTNGDGGKIATISSIQTSSETHVMTLSRPCKVCTLTVGTTSSLRVGVFTTAIALKVASFSWVGTYSTSLTNTFALSAVDSLGFTDLLFGGNSDCTFFNPFTCSQYVSPATLTFQLSTPMLVGDSLPWTPFTPPPSAGNGTMVSGVANIPVTFVSPVRWSTPVFTATSKGRTLTSTSVSSVEVQVSGVTGNIGVASSTYGTVAFQPTIVQVVLTKSVNSVNYVDTTANNNVSLRFNNCPSRISSSLDTNNKLFKGALNVTLVFQNPTSKDPCIIGVDLDSSAKCATCSASTSIYITASFGQAWQFVLPTALDANNGTAMPVYGAVGRSQLWVIQLLSYSSSTGWFNVGSCDDPTTSSVESCSLAVATTCSPSPTLTVGSDFNSSGTATVQVSYTGNSGNLYNCPMQVTVNRAGAVLPPLNANFSSFAVTVCTPVAAKVTTNFSATTRLAYTGTPIPVTVSTVDASGRICMGDSQASATSFSFDLVRDTSLSKPNISIGAVNVNLTTYLGYATATANGRPPTTTAQVVAGSFVFSVMFSNATESYDGRGVRLRFVSSFGTIFSDPIHTVFGATQFLLDPAPPSYGIVGRPLLGDDGSLSYSVVAVDGVPPEWVTAGYLPGGPSVVTTPANPASTAAYTVTLDPAGTFPFQLDGSSTPDGVLSSGERIYKSVVWNGGATSVGLTVIASGVVPLQSSPKYNMSFQTVSGFVLNTSSWATAATCTASPCSLPLTAAASGTGYAVNAFTTLTVSLSMVDTKGNVVLGEVESVFEAYLNSTAGTAYVVNANTPTIQTAIYQRMVNGIATFQLQLLGTTGNQSSLTLAFRCPTVRPSSTLLTGELNRTANPCAGMPQLVSLPVTVIDTRPPQSAFFSGAVLAYQRIIRVRSTNNTVSRTKLDALAVAIAKYLNTQGLTYIDPANRENVVLVLGCSVNSYLFSATNDLGGSVCVTDAVTSLPQCSIESKTTLTCPTGVLGCSCTANSLSSRRLQALVRRQLLANTTNTTTKAPTTPAPTTKASNSSNTTTLVVPVAQMEIAFRLDRALAFPGVTTADIAAAYTQLASLAQAALKTSTIVNGWQIDVTTISTRTASQALVTVAPVTAAPSPQTSFPTPPPAATTAAPVDAAPLPATGVVVLCVTLLMMLLW